MIQESPSSNSGRESFFKTFYSRAKMPKVLKVGTGCLQRELRPQDCISVGDFAIGKTVREIEIIRRE
jgi:hypothetical protein